MTNILLLVQNKVDLCGNVTGITKSCKYFFTNVPETAQLVFKTILLMDQCSSWVITYKLELRLLSILSHTFKQNDGKLTLCFFIWSENQKMSTQEMCSINIMRIVF